MAKEANTKQTKFSQNLTASAGQIKARRAQVVENTFTTELTGQITNLQRRKNALETELEILMDFSPETTDSLTFGNVKTAEEAKDILIRYHNAKKELKEDIEPSLEIFLDLKDELFTVQDEE